MTTANFARAALIISTTPPAPREYGNRNRVYQMIEFLRRSGFTISFLLYPSDEDWQDSIPSYYQELAGQFDHFAIIPHTIPLHQPARAFHHEIDEWWDRSIGDYLSWLLKRKNFDLLLVNYTFLSRAFTYVPRSVLRILDTHDIFTNRRETFSQFGVEPEFFYTSADQERLAFKRADIVIAIKESEAAFIRTLTDRPVVTIPYWDNRPARMDIATSEACRVFSHDRPLRLGFIGAENSVNIVNMKRFLLRFNRYFQLYNPPLEVIIAGNVCRQLPDSFPFLRKLGHVADIEDFYRNVDAIVAPLEFSTGIKVKVGEALAYHRPVIATANAFDGFASFHPTQMESSITSLCYSITSIAYNEIHFCDLVRAAGRAADAAQKAQYMGLGELAASMSARLSRILFITDRSLLHRNTFVDESIVQAVELASHIAPVIAIIVGRKTDQLPKYAINVQYFELDHELDFPILLARIIVSFNITVSLIFAAEADCNIVISALSDYNIEFWKGNYTIDGTEQRLKFVTNTGGSQPVHVSPFRYLPASTRTVLSPKLVAVFRPLKLSKWQTIIINYLQKLCTMRGLEVALVTVPEQAEFDPYFFQAALTTPAARIVVLSTDMASCLFVLQTARYRNVLSLVIGEDYVFPQLGASRNGLPSIVDSIDGFVTATLPEGHAASGPNVGWSAIRARLIEGHIRNS